ncbi:hypothetical protein ACWC5I_02195 [Kitasatospora sp. NPDC001574]
MTMSPTIADLTQEAESQIAEGVWEVDRHDRALARGAADGLARAIKDPVGAAALPVAERLEALREALAVLAITLSRTHGRLAWFLAAASTALSPVLHWRSLPAERAVPSAPSCRSPSSTPPRRPLCPTCTRLSATSRRPRPARRARPGRVPHDARGRTEPTAARRKSTGEPIHPGSAGA